MDLLLKNGKLVTPKGIVEADVGVKDGKIAKIGKDMTGEEEINCSGKYVLPGLIDAHVHLREPGKTKAEDFKSGSMAAAKGGITSVIDMPNNKPSTTTPKALEEKRKLAEKSIIDYGFHFGATSENKDELDKVKNIASVKFYMGSSTGDLLMDDSEEVYRYFLKLGKRGIMATCHCEKQSLIKPGKGSWNDSRPGEAERISIMETFLLASKAKNKVHICHLSSRQGVELVELNEKATCEASPHHLFLNCTDEERLKGYGKVNPPLRKKEDVSALWGAVKNGTVDIIASDHAPHLREEKEREFLQTPSGLPELDTTLQLMLTKVNDGVISLQRLVQMTSENPARIFGIKGKGSIAEGMDADFAIVDLKQKDKITNDNIISKCGWTPYDGMKTRGKAECTICGGNVVFDGEPCKNGGKELMFR